MRKPASGVEQAHVGPVGCRTPIARAARVLHVRIGVGFVGSIAPLFVPTVGEQAFERADFFRILAADRQIEFVHWNYPELHRGLDLAEVA